jgi:hypothetical protein
MQNKYLSRYCRLHVVKSVTEHFGIVRCQSKDGLTSIHQRETFMQFCRQTGSLEVFVPEASDRLADGGPFTPRDQCV